MGLATDFVNESNQKKRSQIDTIVAQLSGDDLRDFIEALNDRNIPNAAIARVMTRRGFPLDAKRVSEYRLGARKLGMDGKYVAK
jgi:hypothetical protein